jgi:hypothetical protein
MHITKKKRDAIVKLHRQGESIELLTAISTEPPLHPLSKKMIVKSFFANSIW